MPQTQEASILNSTDTLLGSGGLFTGVAEDVSGYASAIVTVFSDRNSQQGGLHIQQSMNAVDWDIDERHTAAANQDNSYPAVIRAKFLRVTYLNIAAVQTVFRLGTIYSPVATAEVLARTEQPFGDDPRTTTATSNDYYGSGRKMVLLVNVSDAAGGGSFTPEIQVRIPATGTYFTAWQAAAAITANGLYAYHFSDGVAAAGLWTEMVPFGVPGRRFRLRCVHNNGSSITYSASLDIIP